MIFRVLKFWPLVLVLLISFFVRIIKLEELFYFTYDESVPAFVAKRLIEDGHISLIGGVTPLGFHLAPYFYYFLSFLLFLGNLNPIAWGWAGALIATVTTYFMYLVGSTFVNKRIGIIAACFWAVSTLAVIYDRHLWALYWGPLISLITIFVLYKIIKGKEIFIYPLTATLAFGIHADPSNLIFLVLTLVVYIFYKLPVTKNTLTACAIILLSLLPLVAFDLRHNFANTKPVLRFFTSQTNSPGFDPQAFIDNFLLFPRTFSRLIYQFGDSEISKQYSYCQNFISEKYHAISPLLIFITLLTLAAFIVLTFKNKKYKDNWRIIAILITLYFLGIQLYGAVFGADIFEHYLTGLFPAFLLILVFYLNFLPKRIIIVLLAIFLITNVLKISKLQNSLGLLYKKQAIEFATKEVGQKDFSLESLSSCWRYSGYRYLFAVFGKSPVKSYVDKSLGYLYPKTPISQSHPGTVVVMVIHDFAPETPTFYSRYALFKAHEVKSSSFGNIEVMVLDNRSNWFDQ